VKNLVSSHAMTLQLTTNSSLLQQLIEGKVGMQQFIQNGTYSVALNMLNHFIQAEPRRFVLCQCFVVSRHNSQTARGSLYKGKTFFVDPGASSKLCSCS
jgi:hypothetical protein